MRKTIKYSRMGLGTFFIPITGGSINFPLGFCISNLSSIPRHLREYTAPFAAKVVGLIPDLKENPPTIDVDVPGILLYDFSI